MNPVTSALLSWYDQNARDLPWRKTRDPYQIWVSEVMLQQTRIETAIPYYYRFLEHFPSLASLAQSDEAEVLKVWAGLGYYSRARNLRRGAIQVMDDFQGALPASPDQLRKIRGIGPYTSGAIASIAFRCPVPAVDGNVIRVITRLYDIRENPKLPEPQRRIVSLATELVPDDRPGDHNQAMMDLGATVCTPGTPDCRRCPLSGFCKAFACGSAAELPCLPQARPPGILHYHLLLITMQGSILMRQRTEALLRGLWCFPLLADDGEKAFSAADAEKALGIQLTLSGSAGSARHVFTHRIWEMKLYRLKAAPDSVPPDGYSFIPYDRLQSLPIPAAMAAGLAAVLKDSQPRAEEKKDIPD